MPHRFSDKASARRHAKERWRIFLADAERKAALERELVALLSELSEDARLLIYFALPDELDLGGVLGRVEARMYAPRTLPAEMEFRQYDPGDPELARIEAGRFRVPGPGETAPLLELPLDRRDLALIPGLAAAPDGARLGRGGGYYDRWRERLERGRCVMLLPEELAALDFPAEEHDLRLDLILTERGRRIPAATPREAE